jgi:hypothetical protein
MTPLTRKIRAVLVKPAKTHDLINFAALARLVGMSAPRNLSSMLDRIHNEEHGVQSSLPRVDCRVRGEAGNAEGLVRQLAPEGLDEGEATIVSLLRAMTKRCRSGASGRTSPTS